MKRGIIVFLILMGLSAQARVSVMFHPYDDTFRAIAEEIEKARSSIDIAMYNMDAKMENPVIAKIASAEIQNKIRTHQLQIRLLFQGYGDDKKLQFFEGLGMDVRFLEGKKMHHKFAVIDVQGNDPRVISGSANWSLFSRMNYSENILFFDEEPEVADVFHRQFEFLWGLGRDFGSKATAHALPGPELKTASPGIQVYFNSGNFKADDDGVLVDDRAAEGYALTKEVVKAIDRAQRSVQVATTRIRLRPVYEALVRASQRGVKIQIVVSMDEYETPTLRGKKKLKVCPDIFDRDCSAGSNFSLFLSQKTKAENKNIDLRVKFFNVNLGESLSKQMHSKYVIVDGTHLLTGSFNWSYSSEYSHIENLVSIQGRDYPEVLVDYEKNFHRLFGLHRESYIPLVKFFEENLEQDHKVECGFDPISLTFNEIDELLSFRAICL